MQKLKKWLREYLGVSDDKVYLLGQLHDVEDHCKGLNEQIEELREVVHNLERGIVYTPPPPPPPTVMLFDPPSLMED